MFSSFYNTCSFHTALTTETFNDHSDPSSTWQIPPNILETPASVTFKASIVPSPTMKARKVSDFKTNLYFSMPSFPIVLPFGRFHLVWSVILFFILAYTIIETPYTVSFVGAISMHDTSYIVSLFIDSLLLLDIAIHFRTAYIDKYDRLRIIHEPKLISKHYFLTWFILDFVSAFPFSLIALMLSATPKYLLLFRMLRLIKLIRIIRILKMFKLFQQQTLQYETRTALQLAKLICFMLLTAHFCACFWFFIGNYTYENNMKSWIDIIVQEQDKELTQIPNFTLYSYSIYWSIVTLFTTGYGDITAHNEYEQWTAICCILIGSMFFAYFIGTLSSLLTKDRVHCHEHQKIEEALLFCSHYNLPKELSQAIKTHIRYYQKYNFVFDKKEIMDSLPSYLQKSVQTHLAKNILKGLDIFQSLSPSIIGQIALKLKSKSINMGHLLFKAGDIGKALYIQRTGKSKILYNRECSSDQSELKRGDVCGENVILNRKRLHSVQCETWSEFYSLDIRDIIVILKNNLDPFTAQKEWERIKEIVRCAKSRHRTSIETPRFEQYVSAQICDCDSDEDIKSEELIGQKTFTKSIQELFGRESEKSVRRNESIINNFKRQKYGLVIELPEYFDEECYDNEISVEDKSDNSADSGGFGERFGLYKIRKHKKQKSAKEYDIKNIAWTPNVKGVRAGNINIIDDILGGNTLNSNGNGLHSKK